VEKEIITGIFYVGRPTIWEIPVIILFASCFKPLKEISSAIISSVIKKSSERQH
jgi:hypothetical protein